MDLLTEWSDEERQKKVAALDAETIRNQATLGAWLAPKPKRCRDDRRRSYALEVAAFRCDWSHRWETTHDK